MSALSALCEEFYQAEPGQADSQMQGVLEASSLGAALRRPKRQHFESSAFLSPHADALVSRYVDGLKCPQMLTCRGSALALASLPRFMIRSKLNQVRVALLAFTTCCNVLTQL